MEKDRIKWNEKYAASDYFFSLAPSAFLDESLYLLKFLAPGRRALDIACGEGRNSIFLARHGFDVTAIDISEVGLAKGRKRCAEEGLRVNFVQADLEQYAFSETFDVILNFNFLLRDLLKAAVAALSPGGLLLLETILDTPKLEGMHTKSFLLQQGELAELFAPLPGTILMVEERGFDPPPVGRLIFRRRPAPARAESLLSWISRSLMQQPVRCGQG